MSIPDVIKQLAECIIAIQRPHPVRVAIDGIDAAGKTTIADKLALYLEMHGRSIIRASIDGFHRSRAERYKRGQDSPQGYYEDSFDYHSLREALLIPLGPNGNKRYRPAVFDFRTDTPLKTPEETAPINAILIFDGVFLLRPEVASLWDYHIFVKIDFEIGLQRALQRDVQLLGSPEVVQKRYLQRYYPGQRLYLQAVQPEEHADAIIENNDFHQPLTFLPSQNLKSS